MLPSSILYQGSQYKSNYPCLTIYDSKRNKRGDLRKWLKEYVPNIIGISDDMYASPYNFKLNDDIPYQQLLQY